MKHNAVDKKSRKVTVILLTREKEKAFFNRLFHHIASHAKVYKWNKLLHAYFVIMNYEVQS